MTQKSENTQNAGEEAVANAREAQEALARLEALRLIDGIVQWPNNAMSIANALNHYRDVPLVATLTVRPLLIEEHDPLNNRDETLFKTVGANGDLYSFKLSLSALTKGLGESGPENSDKDRLQSRAFYRHLTYYCVSMSQVYRFCSPEMIKDGKNIPIPIVLPAAILLAMIHRKENTPFADPAILADFEALEKPTRDFFLGLDFDDVAATQISLAEKAIASGEHDDIAPILKDNIVFLKGLNPTS